MPKFFAEKENISENQILLDGEEAKHILKVLRMQTGESLTVCDGCGTDYETVIESTEKNSLTVRILEKRPSEAESAVKITLFQCLPKASKMEYVIQKCTELGIYKIIPCISERCVVKLNSDADAAKKVERWQSIAKAAAKQSGRGIIPEIGMPVTFKEAVSQMAAYPLSFVPYENEQGHTLKTLLRASQQPDCAAFIIGPEGGFAPEEIALAEQNDIQTVTLGKRILRTETAGEVVISMMNYELEL